MEFGIINNVEICVINKDTRIIKKTVRVHNKATRNMVEGIMRFLMGHFTATNLNEIPQYSDNIEKQYIPKYIKFGNGGIVTDSKGEMSKRYYFNSNVPNLLPSWSEYVPYNSSKIQREIFNGKKFELNLITDTIKDEGNIKKSDTELVKRAEMDSMMFFVEILPDSIPKDLGNDSRKSFFITEVGLYSGDSGSEKLLAYVKLNNHKDPTSGDFYENVEFQGITCKHGIIKFNVPENQEVPDSDTVIVRGIRSGTFEATVGGKVYYDKEETPGKLYFHSSESEQSEEVAGAVDYESGLLRIYNYEQPYDTEATIKYTVNQGMSFNTNALFVGENDSIIVRWVITLAALGKDNIFSGYGGEKSIVVSELGTHIISE